jgi:Lar family restriction alleviation protein
MDKLKPCPFCGGEAWIIRTNDNNSSPYVQCKFGVFRVPKCPLGHLVTWDYATEEEAIAAWNRRANDEQTDC